MGNILSVRSCGKITDNGKITSSKYYATLNAYMLSSTHSHRNMAHLFLKA